MLKEIIIKLVDFFYFPIFKKIIPSQTFRYGFCGGINLISDALLYLFFYQIVLQKSNLDLFFVVISPQIAAFIFTFPITLIFGFWLAKYISFEGREGSVKEQGTKYILVVVINIVVKYLGIKFLTLSLLIYPSISNVIMTIVTVVVSYIMQNYFTFKTKE